MLGPAKRNRTYRRAAAFRSGSLHSATLDSGAFFVAHQVRLPELFFTDAVCADDHCFHELAEVGVTEAPADDALDRTIDEFVAEMERASPSGWAVFERWARHSK